MDMGSEYTVLHQNAPETKTDILMPARKALLDGLRQNLRRMVSVCPYEPKKPVQAGFF
jgi:hypothetical protein